MAVKIEGLAELTRAFRAADREVAKDLKDALEEAAQPVRRDAQSLALSSIRNMTRSPQWSRMRVGTTRHTVYVAPVEKGTRGRGNKSLRRGDRFKGLMLGRALEPALEQNTARVIDRVDDMLVDVGRVWERTR